MLFINHHHASTPEEPEEKRGKKQNQKIRMQKIAKTQ